MISKTKTNNLICEKVEFVFVFKMISETKTNRWVKWMKTVFVFENKNKYEGYIV